MRRATITRTCVVHHATTITLNDSQGRPSVRVRFLAGHEYGLPEWWYSPLRAKGALTAPGGVTPPPWGQASDVEPITAPDGAD